MIRGKGNHLLSASAVVLAVMLTAGCGGSEDPSTSSGADLSVREGTVESSAAAVPSQQQGRAEKAEPHNSGKPDSARGGKKAETKSGKGGPTATDAGPHGHSEQSNHAEKRVRELVENQSGTQVVDSGRELEKVLREIRHSKQREDGPSVVEKILEEARGG
jgi:hypothetical protein